MEREDTGELAYDLDVLRWGIIDIGAKGRPAEAFDLMWRFMDLTDLTMERCHDKYGHVGAVFRDACCDIGTLALNAGIDSEMLADRVFDALFTNSYGQFAPLVSAAAEAMGQTGLEHLKRRMIEISWPPVEPSAEGRRTPARGTRPDSLHQDRIDQSEGRRIARRTLQEIADAQGDVDAFAALYDEEACKRPAVAVEIARRLLDAGRAEEALQTLDAAERAQEGRSRPLFDRLDWADLEIDILDALERGDDAQDIRWTRFCYSLSETHLRAYLERLPGCEKAGAEAKALDHAGEFPNRLHALDFLVSWPALDRAASLVIEHAAELDGYSYGPLTRAGDALAARHPLAATLALRAMIDFALKDARSRRYEYAARHLRRCAGLASAILDFGAFETHQDYEARLRREHARKSTFWPWMDCDPDCPC